MRVILKGIIKFLSLILYRVKVIGEENLPRETAAIVCANHVHPLDAPIIVTNVKRKMNVLAKEELFENFILRWLAKVFEVYPIKRNSADMQAIKISLKLLKNNALLLIFPEGTRNGLKKGAKVKNGPVMMAIKAGVPIVPVGFQGSFKPFTKVIVNIGKPIEYAEYKGKTTDKELISNLTNELMDKIIELRDVKK